MRICIIGKFPPIQGGVGVRTYWMAHDLAARGHEVHVITNAKEARPPFRMYMRRQDWRRCEATYAAPNGSASPGSVKVHWTDPVDSSQFHIPLASPFVSKLAAIAAGVHSERPFDVIYSHYLEPYGIAGHLAAEIARVPHVVRMAGSDAGRLWRHPQLEPLYDHVLRSAALVIATGAVAGRAIKHGVRPERIAGLGGFEVREDLFCPEGAKLDLTALRQAVELDEPELREAFWGGFTGDTPFFGIYGKLGEVKGSFALLAAMKELRDAGLEVGLVAMAHGWPNLEGKFRSRAEELGLTNQILQIPFLPHWRVPEFLRSCLAVCCLEQDFPIVFHTPVIAREVLMCGACLVGSTEMLRKLPDHLRLPDGYGCVAIPDVRDIKALSARLAAIVRDPAPVRSMTARARVFAREVQTKVTMCERLERLLMLAVRRRVPAKKRLEGGTTSAGSQRFPITEIAALALQQPANESQAPAGAPIDLPRAREVLAAAERAIAAGDAALRGVASAIRLEIAIAEAENAASASATDSPDPLFRLRIKRWAIADGDLAGLVPVRDPQSRMMTVDGLDMVNDRTTRKNSAPPRQRRVIAFAQVNGLRRDPLFVSEDTARILELSDGTRTAREIAAEVDAGHPQPDDQRGLQKIEELFVAGLLWLYDARVEHPVAPAPAPA